MLFLRLRDGVMRRILKTGIVLMFSLLSKAEMTHSNTAKDPSKTTKCGFLEHYYSKPQITTCQTDDFTQTKSQSRNKYYHWKCVKGACCWYRCIWEKRGLTQCPVYNDCACDPGGISTTSPVSLNTGLPNWCYKPDGMECSWYRNCLEKQHPCSETKHSYALDYAEHICNLYAERMSKFSATGQKWINGVRRCLQIALVPTLRSLNDGITCAQIKDHAFDSHSMCYVTPGFDAPSICDIGLLDWWSVFWTLKGSFIKTPKQSLTGVYEVVGQCALNLFTKKVNVLLIYINAESAGAIMMTVIIILIIILTIALLRKSKTHKD